MVVHALTATGSTTSPSIGAVPAGPRVGFVVSRAVGNSVVRHRVTRRLRHLLRDRIGTLPGDCSLVVRALPAAAGSSSAELAEDLDAALTRLHLLARDGTA
jgi:ribonuclease P protein component